MKPINCIGTDEVICAYCGYEYGDSWEFLRINHGGDWEQKCDGCGKTFYCSPDYVTTFYSYEIEESTGRPRR